MRNDRTLLFAAAIIAALAIACSSVEKKPEWQNSERLAGGLDHPGALTADETNLYYVTGGTIASLHEGTSGVWKMPLAGGTPTQLFKGYQQDEKTIVLPDTFVMASDKKYVYFSANGIYRVPKDGGPAERMTSGMPTEMAVDDDRIYWHNFTGEGMKATPLYSADKKGGEPKAITEAANISAIAIDGQYIYWSQPDGIYRMPKSGGSPAKIFAAPEKEPTYGIAAVADDLYFASGIGSASLMKMSKAGGQPTKVVEGVNTTFAFYVDEKFAYFVRNEGTFGTSVQRVPIGSGPAEKLDDGYIAAYCVAGGRVFASDIANIYRLTKTTN